MAKNEYICDCTVVHPDAVSEVSGQMLNDALAGKASEFFKLFGDITRIRIIYALDRRELCVCDLANVLSMTKSAVSHQLSSLRSAGFVKCRREGKTVYYSPADEHIKKILETAIEHITEEL